MSLFSSGNRKVRARRPKTVQELGMAQSPASQSPRRLGRRAEELGKKIHRLECFIADSPRIQQENRLATLDTLPPLSPKRPGRHPQNMTLAQRREIKGRRWRLALEWMVVGTSIAALVGWLNQWFHFWSR